MENEQKIGKLPPIPTILFLEENILTPNRLAKDVEEQGFLSTRISYIEMLDFNRVIKEMGAHAIVLCDLNLGGKPAVEIVPEIRKDWSNIPIMVLSPNREQNLVPPWGSTGSVKPTDMNMVATLDAGADDYLNSPFSPDEFCSRIRAVLRTRTEGIKEFPPVEIDNIKIDLKGRLVSRMDQEGKYERIGLSRTEWLLIQHLAANTGRVMLSSELLSKVWGPEYRDDLQYLRVWIQRLRQKIERDHKFPEVIKTVPGVGYIIGKPEPKE